MLVVGETGFDPLSVLDFIQFDTVPQMLFQSGRKLADHRFKKLAFCFATSWQKRIEFDGQIASVVNQRSPQFSPLPPTIVSRVSSEYEQQRQHEPKDGVHDRGVPKRFVNRLARTTHPHISQ